MRAIDGPQYSAPPSWTKSSIMSTTMSARFISGPVPAPRARCGAPSRLVRAGLGGAGLVSRLERLAATAARDRVRVAECEAATHERVDDDANAVLLHDRVILFGAIGEGHPIREARAATRCDVDTEGEVLPVLLREDLAQLVRRLRGQGNQWGRDNNRGLGCHRALLDRQVSTSVALSK